MHPDGCGSAKILLDSAEFRAPPSVFHSGTPVEGDASTWDMSSSWQRAQEPKKLGITVWFPSKVLLRCGKWHVCSFAPIDQSRSHDQAQRQWGTWISHMIMAGMYSLLLWGSKYWGRNNPIYSKKHSFHNQSEIEPLENIWLEGWESDWWEALPPQEKHSTWALG